MFLVTGGAGFIGSNMVASLAAQGEPVVVCDRLRDGDKWKNIAKHGVADIVAPEDLDAWLDGHTGQIKTIFHMGAISATTEQDVDKIVANNLHLSNRLWRWCAQHGTGLVYASSAATYGNGALGFEDDNAMAHMSSLRPLNPYGWSKALFDIQALRMAATGLAPPVWAGLKFFNVYGPNEYHKGPMRSVAVQMYEHLQAHGSVKLFRSPNPEYADGGQMRDFVWVGDCIQMMHWCANQTSLQGIYNCGSGTARSFLDLARAVFAAASLEGDIDWVDTPAHVARHYQYFTEANMTRAEGAGYTLPGTSLEDGVGTYIRDYLSRDDIYA